MEVGEVELLAGRVRQHLVMLLENLVEALRWHEDESEHACSFAETMTLWLLAITWCTAQRHKGTRMWDPLRWSGWATRAAGSSLKQERHFSDKALTHQVVEVHKLLQRQEFISDVLGFLQDRQDMCTAASRSCRVLAWPSK